MSSKEKANELVEKFYNEVRYYQRAKDCALIAVDELIEQSKDANFGGFGLYWQEVKQEIEKL